MFKRLTPDTLFGRLALLLMVTALLSHLLALTMTFELRPIQLPLWHVDWLLDIAIRLGALAIAAWVGSNWLSQPIKRLARAAFELGQDIGRPPLRMQGPKECLEATQRFNQMQAQFQQRLSDRDRFVAAVSHDLRTPLTRLRLRAEGIEHPEQRRKFQQDIVEMDEMIKSTLDYLRGTADAESRVRLDVQALVNGVQRDQCAFGADVTVQGTAQPLWGQASALRRCVVNLVENAVRYGESAQIHLIDAPDELRIEVHDHGPGLPEEELPKVIAPFYRAEGSRQRQDAGVGLGLSIVNDIARQHRGRLQLRNGSERGLVASLILPRTSSPD